jgi:hypothetical protein
MGVASAAIQSNIADFIINSISDKPLPRSANPRAQTALRSNGECFRVCLVGHCDIHAASPLAATVGQFSHLISVSILNMVLLRTAAVARIEGQTVGRIAGNAFRAGVATTLNN